MDDHFWKAWVLKPDWGGKGIKKKQTYKYIYRKAGGSVGLSVLWWSGTSNYQQIRSSIQLLGSTQREGLGGLAGGLCRGAVSGYKLLRGGNCYCQLLYILRTLCKHSYLHTMSTFALRPEKGFATLTHAGKTLPVFYGSEALTLDMASSHQTMYIHSELHLLPIVKKISANSASQSASYRKPLT